MPKQALPKLIVILGPTSSGKSRLAIGVAKQLNGEIVNADSRQVYKEMDIGTGKILKESDRKKRGTSTMIHGIRHHLIDVVSPNQPFSLVLYQRRAFAAIDNIIKRKKIPILVGGTGLYIRSVIDNLSIPKVKPNLKLRARLENQTVNALFQQLQKHDPKTAATIDHKNKRRLIRAMEVVLNKKTSFMDLQKTKKPRYEVLQIGLKINRRVLHQRIEKRFHEMMENGLIRETRMLVRKYSLDLPSISGIGYAEVSQYLNGELKIEQAIDRAIIRTRQYARRQETWFRKDKRIIWISRPSSAVDKLMNFLLW